MLKHQMETVFYMMLLVLVILTVLRFSFKMGPIPISPAFLHSSLFIELPMKGTTCEYVRYAEAKYLHYLLTGDPMCNKLFHGLGFCIHTFAIKFKSFSLAR